MLPGSLDSTFLHKPCKLEQKRSSGTWLPQETLLKIDFKQKLHNSAIFAYFYFKIISKLL